MIERSRLSAFVVATALAAAPLAAQTTPSNPFGLSQGQQRTEVDRPRPRHAWRMQRRGERMRWRGERMERRGRWLHAHRQAFRRRAFAGRGFAGRAFAYRRHRWEHHGFGAERRAFGRNRATWRGHERALRSWRWGRRGASMEDRFRRPHRHPGRDQRSRSDGTL